MSKILVVEDDLALSAGLCFELDMSGYLTVAAYTGKKARQLLLTDPFELVLLDVNLPDESGFELCREIKRKQPKLPVIFLTANDLEEDVLDGFDLGAEDYITKPFNVRILKRRMEVALRRRGGGGKEEKFDDGFLCLNLESLSAVRNGEKLTITPNEYKILRLLLAGEGSIVTRQVLLSRLWDCYGNYIDDHTLTVTMNRLRAKIEDADHSYIRTVRGMGYIWMGAGL